MTHFQRGFTLLLLMCAGIVSGCDNTRGTPSYARDGKGGQYSYEYVDLGLSVNWATCNLGARKPEEYGSYYAWGETTPKEYFSFENYKWFVRLDTTNHQFVYSKYNSTDGRYVLELADDAAHVALGNGWRIPTAAEAKELVKNCSAQSATVNGVKGLILTSNISGYTDKWIFFPLSGSLINEENIGRGYMVSNNVDNYYLYIGARNTGSGSGYGVRSDGFSIRPIKER